MTLTSVVDKTRQKQNRIYYLINRINLSIRFSGIFMCMNGDKCCYNVTMYKNNHGVMNGYFSQIPMNNIYVFDTGIDFVFDTPLDITLFNGPPMLIKEMVSFDGANNVINMITANNREATILVTDDTIKSVLPLSTTVYMLKAKDRQTAENGEPATNAEAAFDAEAASMFADYIGGKKKSRKYRRTK